MSTVKLEPHARWGGLTSSRFEMAQRVRARIGQQLDGAATLRSRRRRSSRSASSGFTVMELLVAAGITVAIASFIAAMVANVSTSWTRAGNRLGADAQARIVLNQLQLDLQGAMYRDDGNVWFAVDVLNGASGGATGLWQVAQRNPKPVGGLSLDMTATRADLRAEDRGKLEHSRFGAAGVWLRFFTTSRGTNTANSPTTISAPVAVGYQIIRRFTATNPTNQNTGYLLHRAEVRPTAANARPGVIESGYSITAGNYTTASSSNNGSVTGDPRGIQVPGGVRNLDAVIADNVIDFGVRCYVRDNTVPGGLRLIFPATPAGALSNSAATNTVALRSQLPSDTLPTSANYNHRFLFPDVVDVMVRILTDEGVRLIANMERIQTPALTVPQKYNSNAQQWWWGVAMENSRVYTRRLVINAKPL